jgi:hypothetical protein
LLTPRKQEPTRCICPNTLDSFALFSLAAAYEILLLFSIGFSIVEPLDAPPESFSPRGITTPLEHFHFMC